MGRQWLHSKKEVTANRRAKITTKLVREITVAAKMGVPDPEMNPRLALAVEAARKQSVSNDTITRAIKKGSGQGDDAVNYELVTYEGFGPHRVPVVVECLTDNRTRSAADRDGFTADHPVALVRDRRQERRARVDLSDGEALALVEDRAAADVAARDAKLAPDDGERAALRVVVLRGIAHESTSFEREGGEPKPAAQSDQAGGFDDGAVRALLRTHTAENNAALALLAGVMVART